MIHLIWHGIPKTNWQIVIPKTCIVNLHMFTSHFFGKIRYQAPPYHTSIPFYLRQNTDTSPAPPGESIATSQADGLIDRDTRQLSRGEWGFLGRWKNGKNSPGFHPWCSSVRSDEHLLIGDLENLGIIVLRMIWKNHCCYWTSVWEKSSSWLGSFFN